MFITFDSFQKIQDLLVKIDALRRAHPVEETRSEWAINYTLFDVFAAADKLPRLKAPRAATAGAADPASLEDQQVNTWRKSMKNIYLSFVRDNQFAGATIIQAENIESALCLAWARGLNPGGHVGTCEVSPDDLEKPEYKLCIGRLATRDELLATGKFGSGGGA